MLGTHSIARTSGSILHTRWATRSLRAFALSPIIGLTGALMSSSDAIRRSATDSGSNPSDRAALIEQLLLAGLDQYFAGEYEQAIHVWTRVFFLDRGHARAKAYI